MASTISSLNSSISFTNRISSAFTNDKGLLPISFLSFSHSSRPLNFVFRTPRLRIFQRSITYKQFIGVPIVSCLVGENAGVHSESEEGSSSIDSPKEVAIDIKLPRRRLLVKFTCNSCGSRSEKLVNRLAYERGTVFVQCSGCFQHHKLVDNLGLVVEYDFREEIDANSNANRQ